MFLLLLLLVVVEERLRALRGEVRREGARALAALGSAGQPPNGGNGVIRGTTRRRHAANQLLMLQNPHRQPASCATSPTRPGRRADWREKVRPAQPLQTHLREKTRPARPLQPHFREKVRPASVKTPILGCFERAGRTFSRSRPPSDHAGRTFSRTRRNNIATLKPPTPLLAPNQGALKPVSPLLTPNKGLLKPASPLPPKNAPKTPISRPQRRRRFQSHSSTSEQRRWQFQTTGPPGLQNPDAIPVASGGAGPSDQRAADVTNVVKPTQFKSPREDPCDKRRQSKPKNHHFHRKSRWIDDVCNNTHQSTPKTKHTRPL